MAYFSLFNSISICAICRGPRLLKCSTILNAFSLHDLPFMSSGFICQGKVLLNGSKLISDNTEFVGIHVAELLLLFVVLLETRSSRCVTSHMGCKFFADKVSNGTVQCKGHVS